MEHYGNRRPRVERLVSAWNQGVCEDAAPVGEPDDKLIGASAEPSKRPRTRLTDTEVDAMRTARANGLSVNAVAGQFAVRRGTVWTRTNRSKLGLAATRPLAPNERPQHPSVSVVATPTLGSRAPHQACHRCQSRVRAGFGCRPRLQRRWTCSRAVHQSRTQCPVH